MARIDTLGNFLTDVADSIREKTGKSDSITPANFDTEIESISGGGDTDIYHVTSVEEMNALAPNEKDICVIYDKQLGRMSQSDTPTSIFFPETVVLDSALTSSIWSELRSSDYSASIMVSIDSSRADFDIWTGMFNARVSYTSTDEITYTTENSQTIDLSSPVSAQYEWDDTIGYFINCETISFSGIYQYIGNSWNYLDIGINVSADKILLNNSAYTSNGIINGNLDIGQYHQRRIKSYTSLPATPESGVYFYNVTNASNLSSANKIYITTYDYFNSSTTNITTYTGSIPSGSDKYKWYDAHYVGTYNNRNYYTDSSGRITYFDESLNKLVEVYDVQNGTSESSRQDCAYAGVNNVVYLFVWSTGTCIKYDIATGTTSTFNGAIWTDFGSGLLPVYQNRYIILTYDNVVVKFDTNDDSYDTLPLTGDKIFEHNNTHDVIGYATIDNHDIIYILIGIRIYKYDLTSNTIMVDEYLGFKFNGLTHIDNTNYLTVQGLNYLFEMVDNNNVIDFKIVCWVKLDIYIGWCRTPFIIGGTIYSYYHDDNDNNYTLSISNITNLHADVISTNAEYGLPDGIFIQNTSTGVALPKQILDNITLDKVSNIYYVDNKQNKTNRIYVSNDGTTFELLFDYVGGGNE